MKLFEIMKSVLLYNAAIPFTTVANEKCNVCVCVCLCICVHLYIPIVVFPARIHIKFITLHMITELNKILIWYILRTKLVMPHTLVEQHIRFII